MAKKLTINTIRSNFKEKGYTLLSDEYVNNRQKLNYVCPNNHTHSITWNNWNKGKGCPYCAKNGKPDINEIRDSFKEKGYTLISKEYKNNRSKLEYICPNGHEHKIDWSSWKSGHGCTYCVNKPIITMSIVKHNLYKEGYMVLSKEYINEHSIIEYRCPQGHEHKTRWNNWQQGNRCPTCDDVKKSGSGHPNWSGGSSYEPYCSVWADKEYKISIKERDGYHCLNPECSRKDNRLHIHHIDYNKKNCKPSNLITLCGSCNSKANYNRDWYKSWYKIILNKRYNL